MAFSISIPNPCSQDWDAMEGHAQRKFCSHCAKHVTNLSAMTQPQASRFIEEHPTACIRITYANGEPSFRGEPPEIASSRSLRGRLVRWLSRSSLMASLVAVACAPSKESGSASRDQVEEPERTELPEREAWIRRVVAEITAKPTPERAPFHFALGEPAPPELLAQKVGDGPSKINSVDLVAAEPSIGSGSFKEFDGDSAGVKKTVQRYAGQLKYCYQSRLNENPDLKGRIEIGWSMYKGIVKSAYVVSNQMQDQQFVDCMVYKVNRMRFAENAEGDVSFPFIFRPKN